MFKLNIFADPRVGLEPSVGTVVGWGRVGREEGAPHSSVLQAATVPILSSQECVEMVRKHHRVIITSRGAKPCCHL